VYTATEQVVEVLLQTLDTTIVPCPQVVMQNAMQVLANLGYVLSYSEQIQLPSMVQLETNIHLFSQHLPLLIQGDLFTSMILNSAISMRNDKEQLWIQAYGALILPIRESIDQSALTVQQNQQRMVDTVMIAQRDCLIVRALAKSIQFKPTMAKEAFCAAYQPSFSSLLSLLVWSQVHNHPH
jgi:hypothetical protein